MNKIRAIQELNKKEIEQGMYVASPFQNTPICPSYRVFLLICQPLCCSSPNASWHVDYRDTAFVYFGGLPFELSEGDVITIFSQYGEPTFLKLARDRETGKSRGFGWIKYEDQRSTDLAVDNLGGATIGGRMVSVDHARYKPRDDEDLEEGKIGWEDIQRREREEKLAAGAGADDTDVGGASDTEKEDEGPARQRPMLKEERELQLLIEGHDDDDPMKEFLVEEKKKEVDEALRKERKLLEREKRHKSRPHRSHRSRREDSEDEERRPRHRRSRRDDEDVERKERSRRDALPDKMDVDEDPRERRRRDARELDRRRDHHERRDEDRDDRDRRRDRDSDRRRRGRDDSEEDRGHGYRDSDRQRRRHRDRSKSP